MFQNFNAKFFYKWIESYNIEKVMHGDVYLVDLWEKFHGHQVFHVTLLKKYLESNQEKLIAKIKAPFDYEFWNKILSKIRAIVDAKQDKWYDHLYKMEFEGYPNVKYKWLQVHYCHHRNDLVDKFETSKKDNLNKQPFKRNKKKDISMIEASPSQNRGSQNWIISWLQEKASKKKDVELLLLKASSIELRDKQWIVRRNSRIGYNRHGHY